LVLFGLGAVGVEESVTVRARWTVLPYQTLRVLGSGEGSPGLSYEIPLPTPIDRARGYIERSDAVRLQVVSNGPWKVLVWTEQLDLEGRAVSDVMIRGVDGSFFALSESPHLLASGGNGTFELGVDVRVMLDETGAGPSGALDLIYLIMSD
jgi:hypothetical protein